MIETITYPGLIPLTVVYHDVDDESARQQVAAQLNLAVLSGLVCLPVVRVEAYHGGFIALCACGHWTRFYNTDLQAPVLKWHGADWYHDTLPLSAPSIGGSRWVGPIPPKGAN